MTETRAGMPPLATASWGRTTRARRALLGAGPGPALLAMATAAAPAAATPGALVAAPVQEVVESVRAVADLTAGDGSAEVSLEYVVSGTGAGHPLPARLLVFGRATPSDVVVNGTPTALRRGVGSAWEVDLPALPDVQATRISVRYRIARAAVTEGRVTRVHIPLLTVDRPPVASRPRLFEADLRLPPEWVVFEGFPTGIRRAESAAGVYHANLPVVPSVLTVRARSDGRWRPGLPVVLDAFAMAALLGFFFVGWRHLREDA